MASIPIAVASLSFSSWYLIDVSWCAFVAASNVLSVLRSYFAFVSASNFRSAARSPFFASCAALFFASRSSSLFAESAANSSSLFAESAANSAFTRVFSALICESTVSSKASMRPRITVSSYTTFLTCTITCASY